MTMSVVLFPDSNLFLQFRDLAELPWTELISGVDEVKMLVCRTVQSEIDSFKGDGRDRRADRARKTSSKFRDIIVQGKDLIIRERGPRLTLALAPRVRSDFPHPSTLDMSFKDDRIIAEILAYRIETSQDAALLTADTGPMMTANEHILCFHALPDSWRLPREADERDKQLKELTKQLADLRKLSPNISVVISKEGELVSTPIKMSIKDSTVLNHVVIDSFIERLRERFPMKTDFSAASDPAPPGNLPNLPVHFAIAMGELKIWTAPSEIEIKRYRHKYDLWLTSARAYLNDSHKHLSTPLRKLPISFLVENCGTIPAEGVTVEIDCTSGLVLEEIVRNNNDKGATHHLPCPPSPPKWKMMENINASTSIIALISRQTDMLEAQGDRVEMPLCLSQHLRPSSQDIHKFYRYDRDIEDISTKLKYRCAEFRHGSGAISFNLLIVAPIGFKFDRGAIQIAISARNIPLKIERTFPIHVISETLQTEKEIELMIDSFSNDFI